MDENNQDDDAMSLEEQAHFDAVAEAVALDEGMSFDNAVAERQADEATAMKADADDDAAREAKVEEFLASKVVPIGDNSNKVDVEEETSRSAFDDALALFVTAQQSHMNEALICSNSSLVHYYDFGDTSLMNRFLEAMNDDFSHKAKYVKWVMAHSDATIDDDEKFHKDRKKAEGNSGAALAKALAKPFWKFSKSPPIEHFDVNDLFSAFDTVTKRMTGRGAKDNKAGDALQAAIIGIAKLRAAA